MSQPIKIILVVFLGLLTVAARADLKAAIHSPP